MMKSASLISAALLVFGLSSGSMAADTATPAAAAPTAHKHTGHHKSHSKKGKKTASTAQ